MMVRTRRRGLGDVWSTISTGIESAGKIFQARYAVPQMTPGQFIQQTPQGSVMYQMQPGQTAGFPGFSTLSGGSLGTVVMLGGIGLVLVLMMSGARR